MRILLFSHPRSASTYLQEVIAHIYRIGITGEPFNIPRDNPKQYIIDHDDHVTKICTPIFNNSYRFSDFDFSIFDQIIVTDRRNLALSCASVYYAQISGIYQWSNHEHLNKLTPFTIPDEFIDGWIHDYRVFNSILGMFKANNIQYQLFYYEDIISDKLSSIISNMPDKYTDDMTNFNKKFVTTGIDYPALCTNYEEVEEKFNRVYNS